VVLVSEIAKNDFEYMYCASCKNWGGEDTWVALKGSKSRRNRSCLVHSFNNRRLLLQLRV
jgi:hypothetical protein